MRAHVIVADQSAGADIERLVGDWTSELEVERLAAPGGVSDARNAGTQHARAPLVAWPDDDCTYPPGLLGHVVTAFAREPELDVLVGRIGDPTGVEGVLGGPGAGGLLDERSLWRTRKRANLLRPPIGRAESGAWSPLFGPGGSSPWDAGEDTDWLIRAVRAGLRVRFDPGLVVLHRDPFLHATPRARRLARRYGRCTSAVALAHGYGPRFVSWLVVRSFGGFVVAAGRGRFGLASLHLEAAFGRVEGAIRFRWSHPRGGEAANRAQYIPSNSITSMILIRRYPTRGCTAAMRRDL